MKKARKKFRYGVSACRNKRLIEQGSLRENETSKTVVQTMVDGGVSRGCSSRFSRADPFEAEGAEITIDAEAILQEG